MTTDQPVNQQTSPPTKQAPQNAEFLDKLLRDRYYHDKEVIWEDIAFRLASAAVRSQTKDERFFKKTQSKYYNLIKNKKFCPASPIVMSLGASPKPMLSSCFVLPLEDSMESILNTLRAAGIVTCAGGGIGFDFSKIRPENSLIKSLGKEASLGPVGVLKMINSLVNELKQSGRRKGACMGSIDIRHPDIKKFVQSKMIDGKISNFNLSVLVDDHFMEKASLDIDSEERSLLTFISEHACKTGDPGVMFKDTINRGSKFKDDHGIEITAANTCVTGDTLVAVADGRDYVSIRQLAEENKDILVHCVDPRTGESHVRMGRRPRLTRKDQDIYKVTLDDGSSIKVTKDHKFLGRAGETITTEELKPGDSLWNFSKYQEVNTTKGKKYWNVTTRNFDAEPERKNGYKREHSLIMEYYTPQPSDTYICHHKDDNPLNNSIENLEWITIADHNRLENERRGGLAGENNPMFGREQKESTRDLIRQKAINRYEVGEVQKKISDSVKALYENDEYKEKMRIAYELRDKDKYTTAKCAHCESEFDILKTELETREDNNSSGIFCSKKCSLLSRNCLKLTKEEMISMGHDCLDKMHGIAWKTWEFEYKKINPKRPSATGIKSHFGSWKSFVEQVKESFNHKVVSVEYVGKEDVYNITVDEFHTVAYVTDINAKTKLLNLPKLAGIVTRQCGEIPMPPWGNCLLGSINLSKYIIHHLGSPGAPDCPDYHSFDMSSFEDDCKLAVDFLNDCLEINNLPLPELQEFKDKYKQIGLGLTGFHDALIQMGIQYNSDDCLAFIKQLGRIMSKVRKYSHEQYNNITTLTLAPTGSVSLLLETGSFSIEPIIFKEMDRLYIDNEGNKHIFKLRHPLLDDYDPSLFKTSMEISPNWHLRVVAEFQKFIDNAISKTIMLPAGSSPDQVMDIFIQSWKMGLKGITVYVDQSKSDQVYSSNSGGMAKAKSDSSGNAGNTECDQSCPQKKKRPKALLGKTYKCRSSNGSFYITLNEHDGTAFEIFSTPNVDITQDPARSHEAIVNTEALTRIISLCLRSGIKPNDLAEQLERVKNQSLLSLPKQIADILNDFASLGSKVPVKRVCPSCQKESLVSIDGCWQCEECGWSKCS